MEEDEEEEESEEDLAAVAVAVVIVLVGELGPPPPPFEVATRLEEVDLLKLLLELFELTDMDREEELAMLSDGTVLDVLKLLPLLTAVAGGKTADVVLRSLRPRTMWRKLDGLCDGKEKQEIRRASKGQGHRGQGQGH